MKIPIIFYSTIIVFLVVIAITTSKKHDTIFRVAAPGFNWHYINNYSEKNNCIVFQDDVEYKFCGEYQIIKLKEKNETK